MGAACRPFFEIFVSGALGLAKYNPPLIAQAHASCATFKGKPMPESHPLTILCVSSYEKGQEFLRTCKAIG
ncbi:MAG: hypothetical protein ACRD51_12735, partial [Candidatus Acidiferrum sp.]